MPKGVVDHEGLKSAASRALRDLQPKAGRAFNLTKIGHVVLMSTDLNRSVEFRDPDGHGLEIYWGLDQIGPEGRVRSPEEWRECFTLEDAVADAPPGQDTRLKS